MEFTAELQGEWAESVCDVSRGSHFAWTDDERMSILQIRGHRGIVQRKNLLQCLRGVLLRIAVMWWICPNIYLYTTYLSLAIKQPFHENTTGQVGTDSSNSFSGICLDENCQLISDRSVIIFYRSCDYITYLPWTSEYSLAETGNLCYIAVFWLSAALISFSRCLLVCWHEINKRSEALRSASKYSDPIPWSW